MVPPVCCWFMMYSIQKFPSLLKFCKMFFLCCIDMTPNSRCLRTGFAGGLFLYICVVHGLGRVIGSIATSFDEDMSLRKLVIVQREGG